MTYVHPKWTGKEQLWVLRGTSPVSWTLPVYVKWESEKTASLFYAVPVFGRQAKAADALMLEIGMPKHGTWRINRMPLQQHAHLAQGSDDPEDFFSWSLPRKAPPRKWNTPERADRTAFLEALHQKGVGESYASLEWWWNQFCAHALDWLVNCRKPVDLYFARLHNCPFRRNWKETLLWRLSGPSMDMDLDHNRIATFFQGLYPTAFIAMERRSLVRRPTLELELCGPWARASHQAEIKALEVMGHEYYASYVFDSVRAWAAQAGRCYRSWLADTAVPAARLVKSGFIGQRGLEAEFRASTPRHRVSRAGLAARAIRSFRHRPSVRRPGPVASLPVAMPDLQPKV